MVPICYNGFVKSGRFSRALRTMLARHFVLLTPLECADPSSIPISILNARITLLESALTSHSQVAENTANLSLLECALTSFPSVTPLECALPKNTGGGGRSSHLRTRRSPLHLRPLFSYSCALICTFLHFFAFTQNSTRFFSSDSALFAKKRGVGRGPFHLDQSNTLQQETSASTFCFSCNSPGCR